MSSYRNQIWVTSCVNDEDIGNALTLALSLRRAGTLRPIGLIAGTDISENSKKLAHHVFDIITYMPNTTDNMDMSDKIKLFGFLAFRAFECVVYMAPWMIAINHDCDQIFSELSESKGTLKWTDDDRHLSVILFTPSAKLYPGLIERMNLSGDSMANILHELASKDGKKQYQLPKKYNFLGEPVLSEKDIVIANVKDLLYEKSPESFLNSLIFKHLSQIQHHDVAMLLKSDHLPIRVSSKFLPKNEPIAIIGISCRFPKSKNIKEFWDVLYNGIDVTGEVPQFRWEHTDKNKMRKINAGFLKDSVKAFDANFFGISPQEACYMDPQYRLLMELIYDSLEEAGVNPQSLRGTPGSVFMGGWMTDYKKIVSDYGMSNFFRSYLGSSIGAAAARISFLLGMTGPSIGLESACSSSIVAVHQAVKSLRECETHLALACGVNLLLEPFDKDTIPMVLSPDGRCRTFSKDANGFVRAEGGGVLVLKRLSDAIKDGDRVWGTIRGSATSQEGMTNSVGSPTLRAQAMAMERALKDASISPEHVTFIETHGTGTQVGDPVEVAAISEVYSKGRKVPLILGSLKTNMGHPESCSGIAGIIKTLLCMQNEVIPAHLNYTELNPAIDLESVPALIPLKRTEWKKVPGKPRYAGVSSFGITGTNGHVIIEEFVEESTRICMKADMDRTVHTLKISAKSQQALETLLEEYKVALKTSESPIADMAFSANTGRANYNHRVALVGANADAMIAMLQRKQEYRGESNESITGKTCFLFTGQGSQYTNMGLTLYYTSPVYKMHFDFILEKFRQHNIHLFEAFWQPNTNRKVDINKTLYSQTSIFCLEYALLKLWESWGVKADFVLGHSLGEFLAAYCAGILTLDDAVKLVADRSKLIEKLSPGKMMVAMANQNDVEQKIMAFAGDNKLKVLDVAAVNTNDQTAVAGDPDLVVDFAGFCEKSNLACIVLRATHAFHSKHMDPILSDFRETVAGVVSTPGSNTYGFISGAKGELMKKSQVLTTDYWVEHARQKVNFLKASKTAVDLGCKTFIEIGPHPTLSAFVLKNNESEHIRCFPSLRRDDSACWPTIMSSLAGLYVRGVSIDWHGVDQFYRRKKVSLPTYPFAGKEFWPEGTLSSKTRISHPLLGSPIPNVTKNTLFQADVCIASHPYLKDHVVGETVILPGTGFLEITLAAGLQATGLGKFPHQPVKVENMRIMAPLQLHETKYTTLQTMSCFKEPDENTGVSHSVEVQIYHRVGTDEENVEEKWVHHATGTFVPFVSSEDYKFKFDKKKFFTVISQPPGNNTFYKKTASVGLKFGPMFQLLEKVWRSRNCDPLAWFVAKLNISDTILKNSGGGSGSYFLHPALLDAITHGVFDFKLSPILKKMLFVPINFGKFLWISPCSKLNKATYLYVYDEQESDKEKDQSDTLKCSALLLDDKAEVLAVMSRIEFAATLVKTISSILQEQEYMYPDLFNVEWRRIPGEYQPDEHNLTTCCQNKALAVAELAKKYNDFSDVVQVIDKNIDELVYLNILKCLYHCGYQPIQNEIFTTSHLQKKLKITEDYSRLFRHLLLILQQEGVLALLLDSLNPDEEKWQVISVPLTLDHVEQKINSPQYTDKMLSVFQSASLLFKLANSMKEILTGQENPLQILFPNSSYKTWTSADEFFVEYGNFFHPFELANEILFQNLEHCKQSHQKCGENLFLRICEVGAGTGVATTLMMNALDALQIDFEYTFTDVTPAFFKNAEKKFWKYSEKMTFKKLDLEQDPLEQGFPPAYYDLIISLEVIHNTRNLAQALNHINILLKHGGRFELSEQSKVSRLIACTFGFLPGFWGFRDTHLRSHDCTLSPEKWIDVLRLSGLQTINLHESSKSRHVFVSSKKVQFVLEIQDKNAVYPHTYSMKTWILFHEPRDAVSNFFLDNFSKITTRRLVVVVRPADKGTAHHPNLVILDPENESNFKNLFIESIEGILHCWSLKTVGIQSQVLMPILHIAKAVLGSNTLEAIKFIVFTRGMANPKDICLKESHNWHAGTIPGFIRSLRNENVNLLCRVVDILGECLNDSDYIRLLQEIWISRKEAMVSISSDSLYTHRISKLKPSTALELPLPNGVDRFCLVIPDTKSIADLEFGPLEPFDLVQGQIEIEVFSCALNFVDVFTILQPTNQFKEQGYSIGLDFAGVVKRLGPNVSRWCVGDRVFGANLGRKALASHIKQQEDEVIGIPHDMTFCEASTLPTVFATSILSLLEIAKIDKNDFVLVHCASGGVGLSALQLCRNAGATVIATAGSSRKQRYLKSLGITHVYSSRNTQYEDEILKVTNGHGVDAVLNSLTSEGFKEATLRCCAKGARFVEMSKLSIWSLDEIKAIRSDVNYNVVDLTQISVAEWCRLLKTIELLLSQKIINPIPYVKFDGRMVREGLYYLQKAKHIGKVVCVLPQIKLENGKKIVHTPWFHYNATYLITGGLGGIGRFVCHWMLERGARYIILAGRNVPSLEIEQEIESMSSRFDAKIVAMQLDVGNLDALRELLQTKLPNLGFPSLRGVMHSAGILKDSFVENQSWENFQLAFWPKVDGTLNLHEVTKENSRLEEFVLFSSMAALCGTPGQTPHAAANSFKDFFSEYRHSIGLPSTSINWGQWGQVGVATEVDFPGVKPLTNLQSINGLEYALKNHKTQLGITNFDPIEMRSNPFPHVFSDFDMEYFGVVDNTSSTVVQEECFWKKYDSLQTVEERYSHLLETTKSILQTILKLDNENQLTEITVLRDVGIDSMMFLELKNALLGVFGKHRAVMLDDRLLRDCKTLQQYVVIVLNGIKNVN